jgi:hypothetical protein
MVFEGRAMKTYTPEEYQKLYEELVGNPPEPAPSHTWPLINRREPLIPKGKLYVLRYSNTCAPKPTAR